MSQELESRGMQVQQIDDEHVMINDGEQNFDKAYEFIDYTDIEYARPPTPPLAAINPN